MKRIRPLSFEPPAGSFGVATFVFKFRDGGEFRAAVEYPRGEPENPVSDALLADKFIDCAEGVLADGAADRVKDLILDLDNLERLGELTALLARP
jgi:hypothetical protein